MLSKSLILIGGHGNRKAKFSKKKIKSLLLRSHIAFIAVHSGERCGRWDSGYSSAVLIVGVPFPFGV